jgi:putative hydrolase of the HAD superfamily
VILVFDLDDTIYDEFTFVESGFNIVSDYLAELYDLDKKYIFELMVNELSANGRGQVFDNVLKTINKYSKNNIKKCLSIYRSHSPDIHLNDEAIECFNRFPDYPKYIVTDGNKIVQRNKIMSLGVADYIKKIYITHEYGLRFAKPSPALFFRIAQLERVPNSDVVYIADNPHKDFIGIRPFGFKTIRIIKGMFKTINLTSEFEAQIKIDSLDELTQELLDKIKDDFE